MSDTQPASLWNDEDSPLTCASQPAEKFADRCVDLTLERPTLLGVTS